MRKLPFFLPVVLLVALASMLQSSIPSLATTANDKQVKALLNEVLDCQRQLETAKKDFIPHSPDPIDRYTATTKQQQQLGQSVQHVESELEKMGPSVASLLIARFDDEEDIIATVCTDVTAKFGQQSVPLILEALKKGLSERADQRAAKCLSQMDIKVAPQLIELLQTGNVEQRRVASAAMSKMIDPYQVRPSSLSKPEFAVFLNPFIRGLQDDDQYVRKACVTGLGGITTNQSQVISATANILLTDPQEAVRSAALSSMIVHNQTEEEEHTLARFLAAALEHESSPKIIQACVVSLTNCKRSYDIVAAAINQGTSSNSPFVRSLCQRQLANYQASSANMLEQIRLQLLDQDDAVFAKAVRTIGQLGPAAAPIVPDLISACKSRQSANKPGDMRLVEISLQSIGPGALPAVPFLLELMDSRFSGVAWGTIGTLGAIGPSARSSEQALRAFVVKNPRAIKMVNKALANMNLTPVVESDPGQAANHLSRP